jgi:hypothetical protein
MVVRIRLKRDSASARASAAAPLETCVSPGICWKRELEELAEQQLVEASLLLERERVVEGRDQQDVLDPERHQVLEHFERPAGLLSGRREAHGAAV